MSVSKRTKRAIVGSIADSVGAKDVVELLDSIDLFQVEDHSVNQAHARIMNGELILHANKASNSTGNFNGGGAGNKPIASIYGYEGKHVSKFPVISSEVELRTKETVDDADQDKLGVSYNAIIDINNDGSEMIVITVTNTLGGAVDKYSESGASASMTDYDISTGVFYVVGNLPTYTGGLSWFSNPITLDTLLNGDGGDQPTGYPDATFGTCMPNELVSTDGGHPAGVKMAAIQVQIGGSGNSLLSVTAITELSLDGKKVI